MEDAVIADFVRPRGRPAVLTPEEKKRRRAEWMKQYYERNKDSVGLIARPSIYKLCWATCKEWQSKLLRLRIDADILQLPEPLYRKNQDHIEVDWAELSKKKLRVDFIYEFHDKVAWHNICMFQDVNPAFIHMFGDRIDWDKVNEHMFDLSPGDAKYDIILERIAPWAEHWPKFTNVQTHLRDELRASDDEPRSEMRDAWFALSFFLKNILHDQMRQIMGWNHS